MIKYYVNFDYLIKIDNNNATSLLNNNRKIDLGIFDFSDQKINIDFQKSNQSTIFFYLTSEAAWDKSVHSLLYHQFARSYYSVSIFYTADFSRSTCSETI